jgi:hypothetical protein
MEKGINYKKKVCQLYYQDRIWELLKAGKSVREITHYINKRCIPNSKKFKGITLSTATIYKIIKKEHNGK